MSFRQQASATKPPYEEPDNCLQPFQNIPSNLDMALNGDTNRIYLAPNPAKTADATLLDPEAFPRLSTSTFSSMGRQRSASPYPHDTMSTPGGSSQTWKDIFCHHWAQNKGLFLVTFSQLFGALMNVATRLLELEGEGMDPFQILFARQGLTAIFCTAWMWYGKVPGFPLGNKGTRGLLVVRSVTGFFGIFGIYYSLQYLPVADAVVLTFLAPSVASYGCHIFLKEPFPRSAQYASLISLLGVVLIARPTSFFTTSGAAETISIRSNATVSTEPTDPASFPIPTSGQRLSAVGVAMIGVLGSAGAFTSIRWIGSRAHALLSVNYFSVYCTIISALALSLSRPLHISDLHFALPTGVRQWSMLIFLGICGFIMQYLLTRGLAAGGRGNGARAQNMIYTNMLYALALDKLVFGQSPGWWSLAGSGLILGSAVYVAARKGSVEGGGDIGADGEYGEEMLGRSAGGGGGAEEQMAMLGDGGSRQEEGESGDYQQVEDATRHS
ncbi:uncharacterized protein L3040_001355 [Drepanopeziza brunnea f. sp. 'multigermtubi']|uniref:Integral membrane protein DUF6 n=1 Tax=Marssonina brunnea f. sp. multigermtubi (strain MB_m1) TaxID=1072389 RepID=K1WVX2_MARBU|nr:integral membrane protein DUF6 [Drepanopeziza brunnea f. sp. 'multigermtubi' MB_m1]EKD16612.1 integral membrane protein DUF6 [Drepanopeziza brunnea f. sp. 'multigermtubi' MB_m1]KAJ5051579.1 hypothetical protein L3040_001355 [Drepanopeziza brunnea f. sp. 'multigermtubi']